MRRLLLLLVFLALVPACFAQEQSAQVKIPPVRTRPRIGIALEGGGALGLAHIGVLQWFEDHHIPVDYVAGTSMGGLVGGFYATGKNPSELKSFVERVDWNQVLGGVVPFEDQSFRRKEDARAIPNSLLIGLKHGFSLPPSLNSGHVISLLIERETLPYSEVKSFDELPIPFRCVATDLVTGKGVVLRDGSLADAMRATMSLPGIFAPVRDDTHVYVDGGLVNNLPTDVVRDMGADIVIAVHLTVSTASAQGIQSAFNILSKSVDVVVAENEVRGLAGADLIVTADVKEFSAIDYPKASALIARGTQAAEAKTRVLEAYSLDDAAWAEYQKEKAARMKTAIAVPQFVAVEGTNAEAEKHLEHFLEPLAGKPVEADKVEKYLARLAGIGKYDSVGYSLTKREGQDGLLITVHEKNYAPPVLQPAFQVDGSQPDNVTYTLGGRFTFLDVAGYRSEWRTDFQFGNTYGLASELYKPFTATSKWFLSPRAAASDTTLRLYAKSSPQAEYRLANAEIGADVGYGSNRFNEVRLGYQVGYLNANLRLGAPVFASVSGRVGAARLRYFLDHTDDPVIPRRGYNVEAKFRWVDTSPGAREAFPALETSFGYYQPIAKPASLFVIAEGGSTLGARHTGIPQFFLGGPLRLGAYGSNELRGNQYYLFRAGYLHDFFTLPPFIGKKVYAVGAYEFGKMYGATNGSRFPTDVSAGIIAETALGPLFLGGSAGDTGHEKWYFQLGRVF
jgi:NTE family protein